MSAEMRALRPKLLLLLLLATPALAEDAAPKKRVLKLDEVTVEGRIQKPQAFFILQRSNLNFDQLEKKDSFLPKIQKSCEKDPF
jgi:hypothetical protein